MGDSSLVLWDVAKGKQMGDGLAWPDEGIRSIAAASDGKTLAVETFARKGGGKIALRIVELPRLKEVRAMNFRQVEGSTILKKASGVVFSPDAKTVASAGVGIVPFVWDAATGKEICRLEGHSGNIQALSFSPDGSYLLSGAGSETSNGKTVDATIRMWNVSTGRELLNVDCGQQRVRAVAWADDGWTFAGSVGLKAIVWEAISGKEVLRLEDKGNYFGSIIYGPDGKVLASAMADGSAIVWDLNPVKRAKEPSGAQVKEWLTALASDDSSAAYRAGWSLVNWPEAAIPALRENLRPVTLETPERIQKLIGDLDSNSQRTQEEAEKELARLGRQTMPGLRKAEKSVFEEVRKHARRILDGFDSFIVKDPETLRSLRAIWVLERIGNADAKKLLHTMTEGEPRARPTLEAKAALQRLAKQNVKP